jgi:hypothetical protein
VGCGCRDLQRGRRLGRAECQLMELGGFGCPVSRFSSPISSRTRGINFVGEVGWALDGVLVARG